MSIFTHIVVGTNDLEAARSFYDRVLATLNLQRIVDFEAASMWGTTAPAFMVTLPRDGKAATFANGGTISFAAPSSDAVDAFHATALANGGTCEGAPGPRAIAPGSYAAYVRDRDGNKICTFHFAGR